MESLNYIYDKQREIYYRPGAIDFNYSNDDESYLLEVLQSATDKSSYSNELASKVKDWPSNYHLSPMRSFLLRPFADKFKQREVLEIGSGCGAITRTMADLDAKITVLESSARRAQITRIRCADCGNVRVYCDNFADFITEKKFDIVTLIDVLEYAPRFIGGDNPAQKMLERAKTFLKPGGFLVLATENRLGLKYFNGVPEDHLGIPYAGIYRNYNDTGVITFGKHELSELLRNSGFPEHEFHYPFPDYKMPSVILHPAAFKREDFRINELLGSNINQACYYNMAEPLVWESLCNNKLLEDLSNSFLVFSQKNIKDEKYLASWYSRNRKKLFAKEQDFTVNNNIIKVLSRPMFPGTANALSGENFSLAPASESLYFPGRIFFFEFAKLVACPGWQLAELAGLFKRWLLWLSKGQALENIDNTLKLPPQYFDAVPRNLIITADGFQPIDIEFKTKQEWSFKYLAFRGVMNSLSSLNTMKQPNTDMAEDVCQATMQILNICGIVISENECQNFITHENKMFAKILINWMYNSAFPVGMKLLYDQQQLELHNALKHEFDELLDKYRKLSDHCGTQQQETARLKNWTHNLETEIGTKNACIDNQQQKITKLENWAHNLETEIGTKNACIDNQQQKITKLENMAHNLETAIEARDQQIASRLKEIAMLENKYTSRCKELEQQNTKLHQQRSALLDENTNQSRRAAELLKLYNDDQPYKAELVNFIHKLEKENNNAKNYIAQLSRQFYSIYNSSSWQMTKPLRVTLDKMKEIRGFNNCWEILKKSIKSFKKYGLPGSLSNFKNKISLCLARPDNNLDLFKTVPSSFDFHKPVRHPEVSIIIPAYNQLDHTIKCLYAILQNTSGITYEVILADDNSSDDTRAIGKIIKNIIYIRNESNLGFLKNCNNAVKHCKGRYILFLNNDTTPQKDWLKPLVDFMENDKLIGGVGSKLVFPDGTMQEAGSIIWNDGSCLGYGRGDDHNKPEYSFAREVDYCSGASIMFRRKQFIELGKFDEIYAPAYYEEADFCMTLRKNGYKVMFIPQSVVVHCEFASSTPSKGIELQCRNRKLFVDKWHDELTAHYPPQEANIIPGRSRSGRRRAMIIDDIVPDASLGSGFPRSGHMLDILCEIMDITYCQTDPNRVLDQEIIDKYQNAGVEIFAINYFSQVAHIKSILQSRKGYYDFIFVSRDHNMSLFNKIPAEIYKGAKVIYDAEAITACRNIIFRELSGISIPPQEADNLISKEVSLALNADAVMAVSETERQIFQQYGCKNTYVLGHTIDVSPGHNTFSARNGLLFVGRIEEDAENPNFDSLIYFINNIFDRILKVIPSLELHIVGLCLAPTLGKINRKNIIFHGRVADTKPFYDQCRVFIAPTRFAAGIPLKLNEAAANGIPSVATPLLARQLGWSNGNELLTAATAEEFANSVVRLYNDPNLWLTIRNNSIKRVMHDCSQQLFKNTILNIVTSSITAK